MTITPYAAGTYLSAASGSRLTALRTRFDEGNRQLTTQKVAETYGGLGVGRMTSLSARAQISALDGYDAAIEQLQLRASFATNSVTQISQSSSTFKNNLLTNHYGSGAFGREGTQAAAQQSLGLVVDSLNQEVGGRYLFGGRADGQAPVAALDTMIEGDKAGNLAGVRQLVLERTAADLGPGTLKTGRLALTPSGTGIGVAESAAAGTRANFGFTIRNATTTNAASLTASATPGTPAGPDVTFAAVPRDGDVVRVALTGPDGSQSLVDLVARTNAPAGSTTEFTIGADATSAAQNLETLLAGRGAASAQSANPPGVSLAFTGGTAGSASLGVAAQPTEGDAVSLVLGLRDGTTTTVTLTARVNAPADSATSFSIGATPADTAANLSAALGRALDGAARTDLAASSAVLAAQDFFAGSSSPERAPRRIAPAAADPDGSTMTGATGFSQAPRSDTVIWYRGEDGGGDPRATSLVRVDRNQTVAVGAQANEPAFRTRLAAFAAAVTAQVSATATGDYQALTQRITTALTPADGEQSVESIGIAFGLASQTLKNAKSGHDATRSVLENAIEGVEGISVEEVAAQLLSLQTQLQASYRTTAMLSDLSLTNYL